MVVISFIWIFYINTFPKIDFLCLNRYVSSHYVAHVLPPMHFLFCSAFFFPFSIVFPFLESMHSLFDRNESQSTAIALERIVSDEITKANAFFLQINFICWMLKRILPMKSIFISILIYFNRAIFIYKWNIYIFFWIGELVFDSVDNFYSIKLYDYRAYKSMIHVQSIEIIFFVSCSWWYTAIKCDSISNC